MWNLHLCLLPPALPWGPLGLAHLPLGSQYTEPHLVRHGRSGGTHKQEGTGDFSHAQAMSPWSPH